MKSLLKTALVILVIYVQIKAQDTKVISLQTDSTTHNAQYKSKRISTPEDIATIKKVLEDFMLAISNKNGKQLSTLVLHSRILFTSPGDQARVDNVREFDVNFDGIGIGGFLQFSKYISTTAESIKEKFYNVEITQDGHLAWVTFDYEFYSNDKLSNFGIEHWQLRKIDTKWKIYSVIWTQYETVNK